MIHIEQKPLTDPEVKAIRRWLAAADCEAFKRYLLGRAAELTAEAGNALMKGEDSDKIDADGDAKSARHYIEACNIISSCQQPGFEFLTVQLTPKPTSKPE